MQNIFDKWIVISFQNKNKSIYKKFKDEMIRNVKLKVRKIWLDLFNERQKLKILFLVKIGEN